METAVEKRLESDDSNLIFMAANILNCETWRCGDDDDQIEFADAQVKHVFTRFEVPLCNAGFVGYVDDLLDQWHNMIEYAITSLGSARVNYLKVWYKLFNSSMRNDWPLPLLVAELLFSLPVSNAKVERLFSLMKRIKTDTRASLCNRRLNRLIRICTEGPSEDVYDPVPAIDMWSKEKDRRTGQKSRKLYKKRTKKDRNLTLAETNEIVLSASETDTDVSVDSNDDEMETIPNLEESISDVDEETTD